MSPTPTPDLPARALVQEYRRRQASAMRGHQVTGAARRLAADMAELLQHAVQLDALGAACAIMDVDTADPATPTAGER
jgi:hypothetical protein